MISKRYLRLFWLNLRQFAESSAATGRFSLRIRSNLLFSLVLLECLHLGDIFAVNQRTIFILERLLRCGVPIHGLCGGSAVGLDHILARDGTAVPPIS